MKKLVLKLKIIKTNISRIIMSVLFVNITPLFHKAVQADALYSEYLDCYAVGPSTKEIKVVSLIEKNVFIILVPVAIIIAAIIIIIQKRKKNKSKEKIEEKKNDE